MSRNSSALPSVGSPSARVQPSTPIAAWNNLVFLVRKLDRHQQPGFYVRVILGDLPARQYGPFPSLQDAKQGYGAMIEHLDTVLCDMSNELAWIASKHGTSGLYNLEE